MREMSKKNPYYISKERKLELVHFVKQYYDFKALSALYVSQCSVSSYQRLSKTNKTRDLTASAVLNAEKVNNKIALINRAAILASNNYIYDYRTIIDAAVKGISYDEVNANQQVPVGRNTWYEIMNKFYYILDCTKD